MHYINRQEFTEAPTAKLANFVATYKAAWAEYNHARINEIKPLPPKPPPLWLHADIRKPLKKLFLKNCGYCGTHTDEGNDAEVDHFHPTSKDETAEYVFEWTNYIWSCHSCNGRKSNNFPFLDPCSEEDMKHIYFHAYDGKYLLFKAAPDPINAKYQLTESKSNLNSKNRPAKRKYLSRILLTVLKDISSYSKIYDAECAVSGKLSDEASIKYHTLEDKKNFLLELITCGDHLFLIEFILNEFISKNNSFPYTFKTLLLESNYLQEN